MPSGCASLARISDWSGWVTYTDFSNLTTFANLQVLALPMSVHDGEDQNNLIQPNMHL